MTDVAAGHAGPSKRALLLAVSGLLAVTVGGWMLGLEWAPALLVALAVVALLGLRRIPTVNLEENWPAPPDQTSDRGVRREVARLSWSLHGYESRVERPSLIRLRAVADRRLAQRDLHLDDPVDADRCRILLGPVAYKVLTAGPHAHITFDEFAATLPAVEQLSHDAMITEPR